jgi:hypothetical protein
LGLGQGLDGAAGQGDEEQAGPDQGNEEEGDQGRHHEVAAMDGHAVEEDHRHGILQQGEGHGGKEDEEDKAEPADQMTIDEKLP